jgi:hypothetical protein
MKKYVERDANEIEVTKVSNEYTCIHPVDIKWQHDVLSKCKVPRFLHFRPLSGRFSGIEK